MNIMRLIQTALVTTLFVLVTVFLLNKMGPTRDLVQAAIR